VAAYFASLPRRDLVALVEILHAVRDNFNNLDLRRSAPSLFQDLPWTILLSYYPMPQPMGETLHFVPALKGAPAPDPRQALWARVLALGLVAYDGAPKGSQFLQGFLLQDQFLLRDPVGAVYEFLWANPYQPGLSYHHAPLFFHSPSLGVLFLRSSWNPDATWAGLLDGELQVFDPDGLRVARAQPASKPLRIGPAALYVLPGKLPAKIQPPADFVFFSGLKPLSEYTIEWEGGKRFTESSDRAGILRVSFGDRPPAWIRIR
jgi:hypothetical protein